MNKLTNSAFLVLLISFFVLTSCEKEDSNLNSSLNISLNPGQGLTTADLENLKLGIVKLPDGTTENDNLDSLTWTSEPTWNINSVSSNGNIVFEDASPGLYLVQMDNDTLQFETFSEDPEYVYVQVNDNENTNQSITIILKEADNISTIDYLWNTAEDAKNDWTITAYCYNKQNSITATIPIEPVYTKSPIIETFLQGFLFSETIEDMYQWQWTHHNLRDEYYKIEIEIINNNDSSTLTTTIYPESRTWNAVTYIDEEIITVGNKSLLLDCSYNNTLGNDYLSIIATGYRG